MKQIKFLILFLVLAQFSFGQVTNDSAKYLWYQWSYGIKIPRLWTDSIFRVPRGDTTNVPNDRGSLRILNITGDTSLAYSTGHRWHTIVNNNTNSFIRNQFAAKQTASAWYDSVKFHSGGIISSRGGGQFSIYSPNLIWLIPQSNQIVAASVGTGANDFPVWQLTTFNFNQANTRPGAIMAYNYNTGASSKEFLITTSGFHASAAGDIRIGPGFVWNGTNFTGGRKTGDFHIILDPNGTAGEVQATNTVNFQAGWKTNDSISSSTTITITISRAVWTFTGGSTATWTLPSLSGNTDVTFFIKNKGSADIVLTAGTNEIYSSSATTTFNITAGQGYMVRNDGTHWTILNN